MIKRQIERGETDWMPNGRCLTMQDQEDKDVMVRTIQFHRTSIIMMQLAAVRQVLPRLESIETQMAAMQEMLVKALEYNEREIRDLEGPG